MRIKVEFIDPDTDEVNEIIMDGPDMDPEALRAIVLETIKYVPELDFAQGLDLRITEIPTGTIH